MASQLAAARFGFAAFVLAALVSGGAVASVRLGWLAYGDGYRLMYLAVGLGFLALAAALVWMGKALKRNEGAGRRLGLVALFGTGLLLYPPLSTFADRLSAPDIYDFSTDPENAPNFAVLLKFRGPGSNSPVFDPGREISYDGKMQPVSYVLHDKYSLLLKPAAGLVVPKKGEPPPDPVKVFFWRDFEAAKKTGWTIVDFNDKTHRIEATRASFWFGRVCDIVIEARPSGRGARTVIRSQSRDDQHDDGANAENVKRFLTILRKG